MLNLIIHPINIFYINMCSLIDKIIQILSTMLYFTKKKSIRADNKIEQFEDEWGQFCEIDKKYLHNSNRD